MDKESHEDLEGQLAVLQAKLEVLFGYVQSIFDLAKSVPSESANTEQFRRKVSSVDHIQAEFGPLMEKIQLLNVKRNPKAKASFKQLETFNDMLGYIKYKESKLEHVVVQQVAAGDQASTIGSTIGVVKLPHIELHPFSGDMLEWQMFYEIFKVNIHDRTDLSDTVKLQYLLSKLHGRALSVCAGIPPTAENYKVILDSLILKYEDKRNLATHYLDALMNFKQLRHESASNMSYFVDKFCGTVAALKALNLDNLLEFILFYIGSNKLDDASKRQLELSLGDGIPTFKQLLDFALNQSKILARLQPMSGQKGDSFSQHKSSQWNQAKQKVSHSFHVKEGMQCVFCKNNHVLEKCHLFLKLSPQERYGVVKTHLLCVNCISSNHKATNCHLKSECNICNLKHHTLLHFPQGKNSLERGKSYPTLPAKPNANNNRLQQEKSSCLVGTSNSEAGKVDNVFSSVCADSGVQKNVENKASTVLLSTVKVNVQGHGRSQILRFLLDSGSMCNLITESVCKQLKLKVGPSKTMLSGIGSNANPVQGQVQFKISSTLDGRTSFVIQALVVNNIVDELPLTKIDCSHLDYLDNLELADAEFMNPGPIAGIIGAPLYAYLLTGKSVSGRSSQPVAIGTRLGFVIMGNAPILPQPSMSEKKELCLFQKTQFETQLEKFWELDQVGDCSFSKLTPAEQECENHFVDHVTRDVTGRYIVSLPFSEDSSLLGDSFSSAKRRFLNLEKKLIANPDSYAAYTKGIHELINNGYMAKVENQLDKSGYFIPHHTVIKPDSVSTKQRIVFDASAKTSTGKSLNDLLHSGPKLYSDLFGILLNFRLYCCALNGDITKMFLQILINPDDCKFQKLLWRFDPSETLTTYEMKVVIFGMRCSPFLAQRTVQQLVSDEVVNYPCASEIRNFLYMDDCVASFPTENEAMLFYQDVVKLFKSGGFTFTKWISNSNNVMNTIPESGRLTKLVSFDNENNMIKILGMCWNAKSDLLQFKTIATDKPCTKRGILSTVLSIYDPLGLLGPLVLWVKLLIRELCILKLDWDTTPPQNLVEAWLLFKNQLNVLERLEFPRHLGVELHCEFQLVGFCDASQRGYGAVIYSRVQLENGPTIVQLVCAKSRVAPLKVESIPRLELCSLLLLSKLMKCVLENFIGRYHISEYFCLTDSTVALSWSLGSPHLWNTFVANRVSKIQQNLDTAKIYHVKGTENPADALSRGQLPVEFVENKLFLNGPSWIQQDREFWPIKCGSELHSNLDIPEKKTSVTLVQLSKENQDNYVLDMFCKMSKWVKLLNVMMYVLRFVRKVPSVVNVAGLDLAEAYIVKLIQKKYFSEDISKLKKGEDCGSYLRNLCPFLDNNGILRVGGRLAHAQLTHDQQHPMLLPSKCHVTDLIVEYYHQHNLHVGPHMVLSLIRQRFWIVGGRNLVRKIVQKCNTCFKRSPKFVIPKMGELPAHRVLACKPFHRTACDYLGPINILMQRKRGSRPTKVYVCLFICQAVKAVHLEVVSDLSTGAFLNAFKRFLCRRGPVKTMLSDNGTNFVGANNKLNEIYSLLNSDEYKNSFAQEALKNRIEWDFNPPSSPHFGGLFESNVKSFKTLVYRVVGKQLLTYEELLTLSVQIEGILNSRPLCALSPDPTESPLTPNHFLNLTSLQHIPSENVENSNVNRLTRFGLIDQMVQSFWRRWSLEYLHELQVRSKWLVDTQNIQLGTVVLIKQDNIPPLHWPMGVVSELFPGKDGIVRVASVKTPRGEYKRPVSKLAPLPNQ